MTNLDNRIANADQLLTTDIDKFCESVTDLYSNTCKPMLDVFIYIYRTTSTIGAKTPLIIMMYLVKNDSLDIFFFFELAQMFTDSIFQFIKGVTFNNNNVIFVKNGNL